jgi:hypothetical protein
LPVPSLHLTLFLFENGMKQVSFLLV